MELWWSERLTLEGEAKGKVNALLQLLALRKLAITDEQKKKLEACLDLTQLDDWFSQAFSAKNAAEIFAPPRATPKKTTKK